MSARVVVTTAKEQSASGEIAVVNLVWLMPHNLNIPVEKFNPADWWFEDENGVPMEPVEIDWVSDNTASAIWLDPVRGTWRV